MTTLTPTSLEARLLRLAGLFMVLYAAILTLAPVVRERTWEVDLRWSHWIGLALWALAFTIIHRQFARRLPERDPYLLPIAALLSGWGLMTVWRLAPNLGLRQMLWLGVAAATLVLGLRLPHDLAYLRRFKYLWLAGGLLLTALTLIFGANPAGIGPRLWLGCCGIYFQPSEPLKMILVVYLAAYFADRFPPRQRVFPFLFPTLLLTALALTLLLFQRDLGTASIFILLYAIMLFLATGRKRVLLACAATLLTAGAIGYFVIDVVRLRLDAWLQPWADPADRSYQIIQSLLAVANGGLGGRGPGLGNPGLVPVAISDFIFSAIAEETGLFGGLGLIALVLLLIGRGLRIALHAPDRYRRLMAAGLTTYLGLQSLLIIGGNLRLLPLTGVTLPFVSYGGSSLLTACLSLLLLLLISAQSSEMEPAPLPRPQTYYVLGGLLGLSLLAAALANGWWAIVRGPHLLTRTDNARRAIADRYVPRGDLFDRDDRPINVTEGETGDFVRRYFYPDLAPIIGYTHPVYGQAGLEASLDDYLRGLQGNPASLIWWHHVLYGTPPPGLDIRLALDLDLQAEADRLLGENAGAIILLNAANGEILAMASHPAFDPNLLDEIGESLGEDERSPLLNRAAQGSYPPGSAMEPLFEAFVPAGAGQSRAGMTLLYKTLGFYEAPSLRLPVAAPAAPGTVDDLLVSPLQMALAAAALSNGGVSPPPRIALALNAPQAGWVILPALGQPRQVLDPAQADATAQEILADNRPYWEHVGQGTHDGQNTTWFVGGTPPGWQGTPLVTVVALEGNKSFQARQIGRALLEFALQPPE